MTRPIIAIIAALTPFAATAADHDWSLILVDGAEPGYPATLSMDQPGQVYGRAPCNRYSGSMIGSLPAFRVETVMSTKMACSDGEAEQKFFDLLSRIDQAEQADGMLTLTGAGHELVFSSLP
jgi:heat shock protein HslJ